MLDPEDMDRLFTENPGSHVGYVSTDSGGLMLIDSIWKDTVPLVSDRIVLSLDIPARQKIPVRAIRQNGKRFLIIALDDGVDKETPSEMVEVE